MNILVTPRSFGKNNPELFDRLKAAGLNVIRNETGGILDEKSMIELIAPCEGVIIGVDPLNAKVLDAAKNLVAISKYGVGLCAGKGESGFPARSAQTAMPLPITPWRSCLRLPGRFA